MSLLCRECERYAQRISTMKRSKPGAASLDFNTPEEKAAVAEVFASALQCLSEEERCLPLIQRMLPMLQRGIGVHHSGQHWVWDQKCIAQCSVT